METIIYGSYYGTTEKYAFELSVKTGIPAISFRDFKYMGNYDTIIYIGALYAGGILGMQKTFSKIPSSEVRKYIIVTVGLSDPTDSDNLKKIRDSVNNQVSDEVIKKSSIFCLRGGMDYSKLSLKHKVLMGLVYKKARSIREEKRTEETKTMIETYNKKIDFVDFDSLKNIIDATRRN